MTSLFAVYNSKGKCISYCSAKCYNAKPPDQLAGGVGHAKGNVCDCICNGKNHAQGESVAFKNYQNGIGLRQQDLEAFAKYRDLDPKTLMVVDRLRVPWRLAKTTALARLKPAQPGPLFEQSEAWQAEDVCEGPTPVKGARRRKPTDTSHTEMASITNPAPLRTSK